jgi:hypothetical protein
MFRTLKTTLLAGALGALAATPVIAQGPSFGMDVLTGIELWKDAGQGAVRLFSDPNFFASQVLCDAYNRARPALNSQLETKAYEQLNPVFPSGWSMHHQQSRLSSSCTSRAYLSGNAIVLQVSVPRNVFFFKTTQPTVLGSYADPEFSLDFDLVVTASVQVPSTTGQLLHVGAVTVSMQNLHPDSQNLTADAIIAIYDAAKALFPSLVPNVFTDQSFSFGGWDVNLRRITDQFPDLQRSGFTIVRHDYDGRSHILKLTAATNRPLAVDACIQGYVWREAVPGDHVCVTPAVRQQTRDDNAHAGQRRAGGGGDACRLGFVWREAVPGDHVCVTPATREQAQLDNREARSRTAAANVLH